MLQVVASAVESEQLRPWLQQLLPAAMLEAQRFPWQPASDLDGLMKSWRAADALIDATIMPGECQTGPRQDLSFGSMPVHSWSHQRCACRSA